MKYRKISLIIADDDAQKISDLLVERPLFNLHTLLRAAISEWLAGKRKCLRVTPPTLPAPDLAKAEAGERRRIVFAWRNFIKHRRGGRDKATALYLTQLYSMGGRKLSRRTLYGWADRYQAGGLDKLLDGRRMPR